MGTAQSAAPIKAEEDAADATPAPTPPVSSSRAPRYGLKNQHSLQGGGPGENQPLKTPESLWGNDSASQKKSSGRYKLEGQKSAIFPDNHPFSIVSPSLLDAASMQNEFELLYELSSLRLEGHFANESVDDDKKRIEQHHCRGERCAKREDLLKTHENEIKEGDEAKERRLKVFAEEKQREEKERAEKIKRANFLLDPKEKFVISELRELNDYFKTKCSGMDECQKLQDLLRECDELLTILGGLKQAEFDKKLDKEALIKELEKLEQRFFSEDSLAARLNSDDTIKWAQHELNFTRKKSYLERRRAAVDAWLTRDRKPQQGRQVNWGEGTIETQLDLAVDISMKLAAASPDQAKRDYFDEFLQDALFSSPRQQDLKELHRRAVTIFSVFRFVKVDDGLKKYFCERLMTSLQAGCPLCIPDPDNSKKNDPVILEIYAILVSLAGYVPELTHNYGRWPEKSFNSASHIPVSVVNGREWLVRTGRLLAFHSRQNDEADPVKVGEISMALNCFLKHSAHSLQVALPGIPIILRSLRDLCDKALTLEKLKSGNDLKELKTLVDRLVEKETIDEFNHYPLGQAPTSVVSLLDMGRFRVLTAGDRYIMTKESVGKLDGESQRLKKEIDKLASINEDLNAKWLTNFLVALSNTFLLDESFNRALGRDKSFPEYAINTLCKEGFMTKFGSVQYRSVSGEPYIEGLATMCKDANMSKRHFAKLLRMHFFRECPILVPLSHPLNEEPKERDLNFVAAFARLIYKFRDNERGPFTRQDGWFWLANMINLWKQPNNNYYQNKRFAQCIAEFLIPRWFPTQEMERHRFAEYEKGWFPYLKQFGFLLVQLDGLAQSSPSDPIHDAKETLRECLANMRR